MRETADRHPEAERVELWFMDEARIGQKGRLTHVWYRKGVRPRGPRQQGFASAHLFGVVGNLAGARAPKGAWRTRPPVDQEPAEEQGPGSGRARPLVPDDVTTGGTHDDRDRGGPPRRAPLLPGRRGGARRLRHRRRGRARGGYAAERARLPGEPDLHPRRDVVRRQH